MEGKTVLVTGATSGIGLETAVALTRLGADVVLAARNREHGVPACREVARRGGRSEPEILFADLSVMAEVRKLAAEFMSKRDKLHVLVNNAGVNMNRHVLTAEGIETTMAINFFAPFLLTSLLLPALRAGSPSRIVNVASVMHRKGTLDWDDLRGAREGPGSAYSRSKLALVLFTRELARQLAGSGVTANAVCPGGAATSIWRVASPLTRFAMRLLLKTPREGARLPVWAASSPELEGVTGEYFETPAHLRFGLWEERKARKAPAPAALDDGAARRLWKMAGEITGLSHG